MTQQDDRPTFARDFRKDFDFEDPEFNERFDEITDDLAGTCPMSRSDVGHGYWVVNSYADVRKAAQDWKTFSSAKGWQVNRPEGAPAILPEESDPPYHNDWRAVLNPFFSPTVVNGYTDAVRRMANELIDAFIERGSCEFVSDFTAHLPGMVFFECVMGVPVEDLPELFSNIDKGTFGPLAERPTHFVKVMNYLNDYLKMRSESPPRGDVVDVVNAGVDKDGAPCPWEDKVAIVLDLVFGGLATTTHVMTAAVNYLARNDDDRRALAADLSLVDVAVEEFVRMMPPVVAPARYVMTDTELGGVRLKAGEWITLNYAASSRDPEVTPNASAVDIRREGIVHSAFGVGPHRCLGSNLARLELKVTVEEFLRRIPEFSIAPGTEPTFETSQLRTMTSLQLEFPPGTPQ